MSVQAIQVIDTHTGGEPTRVVVAGGPDLGNGSLADRKKIFAEKHDHIRSAIVNEPRGSDVMVGALLCEPVDKSCVAGVIFFNNVGYLNMCGHGTIGVAVALSHLGKITQGTHKLETPVGVVEFTLLENNQVRIKNVPSYRYRKSVTIKIASIGSITGDVAWGGNWFFLVSEHGRELNVKYASLLIDFTTRIQEALAEQGITGENDAVIDHIELFGPPSDPKNNSRNFVLCPGKAYDRSPCGTGTSAKLACLYADGKLKPGQTWRQESIIGSVFEGSVEIDGDKIIPIIKGSAYINGEAKLILDPNDPFVNGIRG